MALGLDVIIFFGLISAHFMWSYLIGNRIVSRAKIVRFYSSSLSLTGCRSLLAVVSLLLWLAIAPPTIAAPLPDQLVPVASEITPSEITPSATNPSGASLFTENCAACHANGGNIIRRGKNLKQRAMVRNGYGEVSAIAAIVTQGKGIMPAYAEKLSAEKISAIAQYVHEQSEAGW